MCQYRAVCAYGMCGRINVHYWMKNGLLYTKSRNGLAVVCVLNVKFDKRRIVEVVIDEAHRAIGHLGPDKTLSYVRRWYWWPTIVKAALAFFHSCGPCQSTKTSNQKPAGLLHSMPIPR